MFGAHLTYRAICGTGQFLSRRFGYTQCNGQSVVAAAFSFLSLWSVASAQQVSDPGIVDRNPLSNEAEIRSSEPISDSETGFPQAQPGFDRAPTILVMTDGQVLRGKFTQEFEGYNVDLGEGTTFIPYHMVKVTGFSLPDAYDRLRSNFVNPTATNRMLLAEWCTAQGLYKQARTEVTSALRLEPNRTDAIALAKRLETLDVPASPAEAEDQVMLTVRPVTEAEQYVTPKDQFEAAFRSPDSPGQQWKQQYNSTAVTHPRSVADVSRSATLYFQRKAQPMLMSRCATCHDESSSLDLKLHPLVKTSATEQNLQAVIEYIDIREPSASPLVTILESGDATHSGLLPGSNGRRQRLQLLQWLEVVSVDLKKAGHDNSTLREQSLPSHVQESSMPRPFEHPALARVNQQQEVIRHDTVASGEIPLPRVAAVDVAFGTGRATAPTHSSMALDSGGHPVSDSIERHETHARQNENHVDAQFLRDLLEDHRPDAFDPAAFNRKMHGTEAPSR